MCSGAIQFSTLTSVKVVRDGDGDGRCQEEGGKWVPCPPGVASGHVIDAAGRAVRKLGPTIGEAAPTTVEGRREARREELMAKASEIRRQAEQLVPEHKRAKVRAQNLSKVMPMLRAKRDQIEKKYPRPKREDFIDMGQFNRALRNWKNDVAEAFDRDRSPEMMDFMDATREIFTHEIQGRDGRKYRMIPRRPVLVVDAGELRVMVLGEIVNMSGEEVGDFSRVLRLDGIVTHNFLNIDPKMQGTGIGSAVNAATELLYREMGFTGIDTSGLSDEDHIGATHWPKNGFDWANEMARDQFINIVEQAIDKYEQRPKKYGWLFDSQGEVNDVLVAIQRAKKERLTDSDRITAADLLAWPGAERWFQQVDREGTIINYKRRL